jgi:alpha/beta superfamily hydrolase
VQEESSRNSFEDAGSVDQSHYPDAMDRQPVSVVTHPHALAGTSLSDSSSSGSNLANEVMD